MKRLMRREWRLPRFVPVLVWERSVLYDVVSECSVALCSIDVWHCALCGAMVYAVTSFGCSVAHNLD